jgi:hypothetical protein
MGDFRFTEMITQQLTALAFAIICRSGQSTRYCFATTSKQKNADEVETIWGQEQEVRFWR